MSSHCYMHMHIGPPKDIVLSWPANSAKKHRRLVNKKNTMKKLSEALNKQKKDFTKQLLQNIRFDLGLFISAAIMWHSGIRYTNKWVWTF